MPQSENILDNASTPLSDSNRPAQIGLMIRYLAPTGILVTAFVTGWYIESTFPSGDSRNIGSPCCMVVMAPAAIAYFIPMLKEAVRPNGVRALFTAAVVWLMAPLLCWLIFYTIVRFGLWKHA